MTNPAPSGPEASAPVAAPPKKSDLGVRTLSAIVMVAVAGGALWIGGWVFTAFVVAVGLGVLWEWWGLARRIAASWWGRALWLAGGVIYIGLAMEGLLTLRESGGLGSAIMIIGAVIAVDVGAYFAGRSIGGPKIAPSISPSKTWAGLVGGMIAAAAFLSVFEMVSYGDFFYQYAAIGGGLAVIAQVGDFFESWMKRRAGVKDSGNLIPGHGGLFDRLDGMLTVLCCVNIIYWAF